MNRVVVIVCMFIGVGFLNAPHLSAYNETPLKDGGVVAGKITYQGTPPPPEHFKVTKNPDVCGAERDHYAVEVNNGALIHAVVMIEGVTAGKPLSSNVVDIVSEDCTFLPFMSVVARTGKGRKGSPFMTVLNEDTVIHNPHPFEFKPRGRRTLWNLGLPEKGSSTKKRLVVKESDTVRLECDQHNFMLSWTNVVSNPYWAITGNDGSYAIDQVPPGTYKLVVWHPILGEQIQEITVPENESLTVHVVFSGTGSG